MKDKARIEALLKKLDTVLKHKEIHDRMLSSRGQEKFYLEFPKFVNRSQEDIEKFLSPIGEERKRGASHRRVQSRDIQ